MIQVSFKSLCKNEAYKKTKKILDAFAIRTGEKTWETFTTYKVLNNVIKKLKQNASKNTSISIFIHTKHNIKLYATIGKKLVNEHGGIPISYTSNNKNFFEDENNNFIENLKFILEFSAIFHDLGKNNNIFQEKIWKNSKEKDIIRHDFLSIFLLWELLVKKHTFQWITENFYDRNIIPDGVNELNEFVKYYLEIFLNNLYNPFYTNNTNEQNEKKFLLFTSIILFHHKYFNNLDIKNYVEGFVNEGKHETELKNEIINFIHIFLNKEYIKNIDIDIDENEDKFIINNIDIVFKKKINNKKVLLKVKKEFDDLLKIKFEEQLLKYENFNIFLNKKNLNLYFYLGRSFLMYIDHNISKQDLDNVNKNMIVANKKQLLTTHLLKEKNSVEEFISQIFLGDMGLEVKEPGKSNKTKFIWQDNIVEKIKKHKNNTTGSFILLNAETGTGKTIGSWKILCAINDNNVAVNYLYGLRVLTKQTFASIKKFAELKNEEIGYIIGTIEKDNENSEYNYGQENIINDYIIDENIKYIEQEAKTEKLKELLHKPITVSTIDYITNIIKFNKTKYLLPLFKIIKNDIVIDEIDNFLEKEQIETLEQIAFLAGLFNKNFMISSATVNKKLVIKYLKAYNKGYSINNYIQEKNNKYLLVLANNFNQEVYIENDINTKINKIEEFYQKKVIKLEKDKTFNKKTCKILDGYEIDTIYNEIIKLHDINNTQIADKKFSFGFIKFFSINDLINYYYKIEQKLLNSDIYFKINFLHSNLGLNFRNELEKHLHMYLYKNNNNWKEYIEKDIKNINNKNVIYLLFATPVISVGKDWDFDWGISQYINNIEFVQTPGRIYRHRSLKKNKHCMSVFFKNTVLTKDKLTAKFFKNNDIKEIILNSLINIQGIKKDSDVIDIFEKEYGNVLFDNETNIGFYGNTKLKFRKNTGLKEEFLINNEGEILSSKILKFGNKIIIEKSKDIELPVIIENNKNEDIYNISLYNEDIKNYKYNNLTGLFK